MAMLSFDDIFVPFDACGPVLIACPFQKLEASSMTQDEKGMLTGDHDTAS